MIRIAKGSIWWIAAVGMCALALSSVATFDSRFTSAAIIFILITIFFIGFFRDPHRMPDHSDLHDNQTLISPADGRVMVIEEGAEGKDGEVQIFMNFHNVHVNRSPIAGTVESIRYRKGSHIPAFTKSSVRNERNELVIANDGVSCTVTQIAGTITRRIVPYLREGDFVERGGRIGMIRFGSRVDVTIPPGFEPTVRRGDIVRAGETVIAVSTPGTNTNTNTSGTPNTPNTYTDTPNASETGNEQYRS